MIVKKEVEELRKIAKSLGLDYDNYKVCKEINGKLRCGLIRRVTKRGIR